MKKDTTGWAAQAIHLENKIAALEAEVERLRKVIPPLIEAVKASLHNKDLRCSYDDYGTGASGMAAKPCAKYRAKSDRVWWCRECQVRPLIEDAEAALEPREGREEE